MRRFIFENHVLDVERRKLVRAGEGVPLKPQVLRGFRFIGDTHVDCPPTLFILSLRAAGQDGEPLRLALPVLDRAAIAVLPSANLSGEAEQEYFPSK